MSETGCLLYLEYPFSFIFYVPYCLLLLQGWWGAFQTDLDKPEKWAHKSQVLHLGWGNLRHEHRLVGELRAALWRRTRVWMNPGHEPTLCAHSLEPHPGQYQRQRGQEVQEGDAPLYSVIVGASPGELHPALGSSAQERLE